MSENKPKIAIVGGGISGLVQAKEALEKGYDVTVLEAQNRFGGKIENGALDGQLINVGAEFIDSDNNRLIKLAQGLNVKLAVNNDQENVKFFDGAGNKLSSEEFDKIYRPIQEWFGSEQAKIAADPEYKKSIDKLSLPEYTDVLKETIIANNKEQGIKTDEAALDKAIKIAVGAYGSEVGEDRQNISARQFLNEASAQKGEFLASDCKYHVEGGTYAIIDSLKKDLEAKGVKFAQNSQVGEVGKTDGTFELKLASGEAVSEKFDAVGLAVPAHELAKIKGLENLGMSEEDRKLLSEIQYTHSSKIFMKVNDDFAKSLPDETMFTGENWQAWKRGGVVTFLVGGQEMNAKPPEELQKYLMQEYAKAQGIDDPEKIFARDESGKLKVVHGAPDTKRPCYASPLAGQLLAMEEKLENLMNKLAEKGIAIAGSFIPMDGSVGFMEAGLASAERSMQKLQGRNVEKVHKVQVGLEGVQSVDVDAANSPSYFPGSQIGRGGRGV